MSDNLSTSIAIKNTLKLALTFLQADSLIFYPYDFEIKELNPRATVLEGYFNDALRIGGNLGIPQVVQYIYSSKQPQFWVNTSKETQHDINFFKPENIRSSAAIPLVVQKVALGVLLINYRTPKKFTKNEQQEIEQACNDMAFAIRDFLAIHNNIQITSENILRTSLAFPSLLPIEQFTTNISSILNAISFVYSVFAILTSRQTSTIQSFLDVARKQTIKEEFPKAVLSHCLENANIEPLQISSMHYGSPVSFDLLGIGSALEVLRDILKDVAWRGKHEKDLAELERKSKQADITSARLEHEKTTIEMAIQKTQIEKAKLENEKLLLDIAMQKLDFLQKINGINLPDDDKKMVVALIMPKMEIISKSFAEFYTDEMVHS